MIRLGTTPTYGPRVRLCGCSVHKAERKVTRVGKYVATRHPALAKGLSKTLTFWAKKIAKKASRVYEEFSKSDADTVKKILAMLDATGMATELVDDLSPELLKAFKAAGIFGLAQIKFDVTPELTKHLDKAAKQYAEERGAELVKDLNSTTEEYLRGTITRAVEEGYSTSKLSDAIQESGAFGEFRADMIARTELAFAHVQGNVQGWKETGLDVQKRSILGDLHDITDICDECADAGTVAMDADFVEGFAFPPYHPNCICDISPVLNEGENE